MFFSVQSQNEEAVMSRSVLALVAACLFAFLSPFVGPSSAQQGEVLCRIDAKDVSRGDLATRMDVLKDVGTYYIARGGEASLEQLSAAGIAAEILDRDPSEKTYYVVYLRDRAVLAALRSYGDVLFCDDRTAVVRASEENGRRIPELGVEIERIFMEPLKAHPVSTGIEQARLLTVHPEIQQMVEAVDQPTLENVVNDLVAFETRASNTSNGVAASHYIYNTFRSYGIADVAYHDFDSGADNVVATIPGARFPENIIVLGGHYDSIASGYPEPGADDNASGTAAVLEAARILSGYQFENTIRFIAFASEEFGLVGSYYYARQASERGDNILGMLNVDMIGYLASGDTPDIDIVAGSLSAGLREVAFWAIGQYVPWFPAIAGTGFIAGTSDHASFTDFGYPAIWFFEDVQQDSPYIHTPNDTVGLSLNSFYMLTNSTKAIIATLATLAEPVDTIAIGHTPLRNTSETSAPYPVVAKVVSVNPLASGYPILRYRIDGGSFTEVVMNPTGTPDEYSASIPPQSVDTTIGYYIEARDTDGLSDTSPGGAPAVTHSFKIVAPGWTAAAAESSTIPGSRATSSTVLNWLATVLIPPLFALLQRRRTPRELSTRAPSRN